jgi:hypothetical protein
MSAPITALPPQHSDNNTLPSSLTSSSPGPNQAGPSQPRQNSFSQPQPIAGPSRNPSQPSVTPSSNGQLAQNIATNGQSQSGQLPSQSDQQLYQARMALAQQAIQQGQIGQGQARRTSGPGSNGQDWAAMAGAMAMANGGQSMSKEAMLKQVRSSMAGRGCNH